MLHVLGKMLKIMILYLVTKYKNYLTKKNYKENNSFGSAFNFRIIQI